MCLCKKKRNKKNKHASERASTAGAAAAAALEATLSFPALPNFISAFVAVALQQQRQP